MRDSDYYPAGAYNDPRAPYNQVSSDPIDVDITAIQVLTKDTTIATSDYTAEAWKDCDVDEEGCVCGSSGVDYTYENVDFEEEFLKDHLTPLELIDEFSKILIEQIDSIKAKLETAPEEDQKYLKRTLRKYTHFLDECSDWEEESFYVDHE